MWQSAKWWTDFYKSAVTLLSGSGGKAGKSKSTKADAPKAVSMVPEGYYKIGQVSAAIVE